MTAQSSGDRRLPMKRQRDTAIRAVACLTAIAAQQRRGKPTPIQKQNRLLSFLETVGNCLRQSLGQNGGFLFLPSFLAQIDNTHERHLLLIDALRERKEPVLSNRCVVITFERWRGAAQNDDAFFDLRADDCDVAGVISRRFLLFVGCFVFFIDNDESEVLQRGEHSAARADHDAHATGTNFVPFIVAFAFGQMTVQNRDGILLLGEPAFEAFHRLRRKGNFGYENNGRASAVERSADGLQINFRFAGTCYTVEQNRARVLR
jgi:hypothetical protein